MNLGWGEWLIIAFILVLLFGAKRLPELAKSIGSSIKQFQKGIKDIEHDIDPEDHETEKKKGAS